MTIIKDIWGSFMAQPMWVKAWMVLILMPANFATAVFIKEPYGIVVASLAILGMAFNMIPMIAERGFGKAMAIPHVIFWVPLVVLILLKVLPVSVGPYKSFLIALLVINIFSLAFDIPDSLKWLKGDRIIPR